MTFTLSPSQPQYFAHVYIIYYNPPWSWRSVLYKSSAYGPNSVEFNLKTFYARAFLMIEKNHPTRLEPFPISDTARLRESELTYR